MTPNKEDYLKTIFKLGGGERLVPNKDIAQTLGIAAASVSEMLVKLSKEGLLEYEPYKGSRLTSSGLQKAISMVRGHRLWEVFLMRHLQYSWSEAHEDAELLEHITPSRLTNRLDRFLNFPAYCPHGAVIPQPDGVMESVALRPLSHVTKGERTQLRLVTEERELLDYMEGLGVKIGSDLEVLSVGAYEGPVTVKTEGKEVSISYKAACQIYVTEKTQP